MEPSKDQYKEYRYSLSVTSQFYFCGIPFRLDISPKCDLNCAYCFAMARGGRRTNKFQLANPNRIRSRLEKVFLRNKIDSIDDEFLFNRIPIHLGGMSDPFSTKLIRINTNEILDSLMEYNYPVVISTKNPYYLLEDEILKKIANKKVLIQVSFSVFSRKISALIEPQSISPYKRLKYIDLLNKEGFNIIARLQPLLYPFIADDNQHLIQCLSEVGCKHVVTEFLKLPVERNITNFVSFLNDIKWDAYRFYKNENAKLIGREWVLPAEFIYKNKLSLVNNIHKYQMTHSHGDYGLNHLGDSDCCCGLDLFDGFDSWFKGNFASIIRNSKSDVLSISELKKYWYPNKSISEMINSHSRLDSNMLTSYLYKKWNSPGTANAPDSFYGIKYNNKNDEQGNCIYHKYEVIQ